MRGSKHRSGPGPRAWARARAVGCALAAALACAGPEAPTIPPGAHLVAEGDVLRDLLVRVEGLHGTPLGRRALAISERITACDSVVGHAGDGSLDALLDSLDCGPPPARLEAARAGASLLWVVPIDARQRWVVTGGRGASGLVLEARLDPPGVSEHAALLLPSADAAGPPVLAAGEALLHARVRPSGGLDLARLVPSGSQGDRLFRLKSSLFGSAVLGGVWEIAVYMPEAGEPLPPMALALDVRRRDVAVTAMEGFLRDLAAAWPIHPTPARFGDALPREGVCLFDLRIMPGFAPCYVATERALVIGWNPASVERALAGGADGDDGPSRLALRFDRLGEADRRLQAARRVEPPALPRTWGWQRLDVAPSDDEGAWRIELVDVEPAG